MGGSHISLTSISKPKYCVSQRYSVDVPGKPIAAVWYIDMIRGPVMNNCMQSVCGTRVLASLQHL